MPWSQTMPRDQRVQFIADYLRNTLSMTELCDRTTSAEKRAINGSSVTSVAAPLAWRNSHVNLGCRPIKPQLRGWQRSSRLAATIPAGA
jgi:hypothetical protein